LDFDIQVDLSAAEMGLIDLRHIAGVKLLLKIMQQHLMAGKSDAELRYEILKKVARERPPWDPRADADAVQELATEIRGVREAKG
jgi:hypothetical protein